MKILLTAAAMAPLLIACASADAQPRVLVVNGERIALGGDRDAAGAIEDALSRRGDQRVRIELELDETDVWDDAEREAFAAAMAALASGFARDAMAVAFGSEAFEFELDHGAGPDEIARHVARAERHAERRRHSMERHAEQMARHAERIAARAERDDRHVRVERRNGSVRAWVNGEEVTGAALDALLRDEALAGAPDAPPPPHPRD